MKIKGQKIEGVNTVDCIIKKSIGEIKFTFKAVVSFKEFEALVSEPTPPIKQFPSGVKQADLEDADFVKARDVYAEKKTAWMFLESISATEGLEWENIDKKKSDTWANWQKELEQANFTAYEIGRLLKAFFEANGMSNEALQTGRDSFLAGQRG